MATATIPSRVFDTRLAQPHERFALWRAALAPTHEALLPDDSEPANFDAWARSRHLGNALLLESRAMPQRLVRSSRTVRADQIDHYIVRLQAAGVWTGEVGGRTVVARPGSILVLDMARASTACTTETGNVNLMLPRDALDDLLPPFDMHGLILHNGMAALLRRHLIGLARLPDLLAAEARRIEAATVNLVAACLAPAPDTVGRARGPLEAAVIAEVRRYVDRHLHAPDLTPSRVGAALGLPRSTLYAVCAPMGGVAAFIQKRRLRRIHAILADARDRRPIAEIAYQYGFPSGAHFSRAFRRTFGYSPREVRDAGFTRPADSSNSASPEAAYKAWVLSLGG
jgi:AraC-like DNA-binding protein